MKIDLMHVDWLEVIHLDPGLVITENAIEIPYELVERYSSALVEFEAVQKELEAYDEERLLDDMAGAADE